MTERYKCTLAYDGTEFKGFQKQARSRTVQGVVEEALRRLGWSGKSILAAGRTDTGVHASGQVIAFDLDWRHSPQELRAALNAELPPDAAVRDVRQAAAGFHPRYSAVSRCYRYRIVCDEVRSPLMERYAWRLSPPADLGLLEVAAADLVGVHDFAAFGSPPRPGGSTVRNVFGASWQKTGQYLVFEIAANAFLYHMVRRITAAQVEIGQGSRDPGSLRRYLEGAHEQPPVGLAPAHGLELVAVEYESDEDRELPGK